MTRDEIIEKYMKQHNELSYRYYETKREKAKRIGLYLTPNTTVETGKRGILRNKATREQNKIKREFERGEYQNMPVVRELEIDEMGRFNFVGKPFRCFKDLTPSQKDVIWEMILDEDEFNEEHAQIWDKCNQELIANGYEPI